MELICIRGCRVSVSLYFAVFVACLLVLDHTGLAIFALLCAAFHEMGHIATISALKVPVSEMNFRLFGANIKLKKFVTLSYKQEILVALSGCIANIVLCLVCFIAVKLNFFVFYANMIFLFSLIIAGFNIIPISPLDGGRALTAYLTSHMQYQSAEKIMNILSFVFIIPLGAVGLILLIKTGYNFSLIVAVIYLASSLFLKRSMFVFKKTSLKNR
jgi:stage IV sporulation protein FB